MHRSHVKEGKRFWLYILVGTSLLIASLGFGRMGYGIVMPFMREDLAFTYDGAGLIGTANALAYLVFSGMSGKLVKRWGNKAMIILGGCAVAVSYGGLSLSNDFYLDVMFMFLNGMGTAFVFIPLVGMLVGRFPHKRGLVIGFLMSGGGAGVLLAGMIIPALMMIWEEGWRYGWAAFGIFAALVTLLALVVLKDSVIATGQRDSTDESAAAVYREKGVLLLGLLYFSVGTAYLIPMTFQMGYMIAEGMDAVTGGTLFATGGVLAIISGPVWGALSDRFGRALTLVLAILFFAMANIASVILPNFAGFLLTQILLGSTISGMFALIQASLTEHVPVRQIPAALGYITVFFSVGQFLGPMLGGFMIEHSAGFKAAHLFSTFMTAIGLYMAIVLYRSPKKAQL
ncbi:MAG: hypothetical protein BAA01_10560 [Bacillus thermozeamaize]|uniref:Major facilitator superfamily (MFS) profile domain-containing protein n=1 Tax=Bacillus thermozeamaize TaxID=230954 RepID=A0A1Y3PDS1_9BACI|nr:MAG: hypothetical protein BAA01_10560 [Bacillus thermozeamaize]